MSGYIGKAKAVNFAKVDLPIRDGDTNIIEQDGSYYLKEGASIKDQNGNTIIASDGTIAGVDFTPIETQLDSIEQDITSLDTSIGLLEDSVANISIDILTHKSILDENYVVEANTSALLMGPVKLPGSVNVSKDASLTVFGEISVTGDLDISGTFSVR